MIDDTYEGVRDPEPMFPPSGASVVYLLKDHHGEIIYVGISNHFRSRLRAHRSKTPDWVTWECLEVDDRAVAAITEAVLIRGLQPRLNVAGR